MVLMGAIQENASLPDRNKMLPKGSHLHLMPTCIGGQREAGLPPGLECQRRYCGIGSNQDLGQPVLVDLSAHHHVIENSCMYEHIKNTPPTLIGSAQMQIAVIFVHRAQHSGLCLALNRPHSVCPDYLPRCTKSKRWLHGLTRMLFAHNTVRSKAAVPPELRHHLSPEAESLVLLQSALCISVICSHEPLPSLVQPMQPWQQTTRVL